MYYTDSKDLYIVKKKIDKERRKTASVRNMPIDKWKRIRIIAKEQDRTLKSALDEMIDYFLGKHDR